MPFEPILDAFMTSASPVDPSEPKQRRLYRLIKAAVVDGSLPAGSRLPASRDLAARARLSRNGVIYAYQQLLAEGFLEASPQGTRVARLATDRLGRKAFAAPAAEHIAVLSTRARTLPRPVAGEAWLPFSPGVADLNAFPWRRWAKALQRAWSEVSARQVASAEPGGEPALRREVAAFLAARRGVVCNASQVFILPGAQIALDACARLLADAGDIAWIEDPCYLTARNVMLAAGLETVPLAVDENGIAPSEAQWHTQPPRLIYLTPSHQYPLGSVLSFERRLHLLDRLESGRTWLIEDDYDSDFNHARPGAPLQAIQGLAPEAPVIYIGTFSKLLYPGLRIAYMVVPRWAVDTLAEAIKSLYRGGLAVEQRALARLLHDGELTRHLRVMAPRYAERQRILRTALRTHFSSPHEVLGGSGGLHLTLRMTDDFPDEDVCNAAADLGVIARPLGRYYATPGAARGLVLGYGMAEEARIPELVERLEQAVRQITKR